MKKYQLIGRRAAVKQLRKSQAYPVLHICQLPYEILTFIFSCLQDDISSILLIAATCSKFNTIVLKLWLYRLLKFKSASQFSKFSLAHLPHWGSSFAKRFINIEPSAKINFITSVHLINPPSFSNPNALTSIAGSYTVNALDGGVLEYQHFVRDLRTLFNEAYGLKEVKISEISPRFEFSPSILNSSTTLHLMSKFKPTKQTRCLDTLELSAQSGWMFPFKLNHLSLFLSVFYKISLLRLTNFAISEQKLQAPDTDLKDVTIESLSLNSCIYMEWKKLPQRRQAIDIFLKTSELRLSSIQNGTDLSLIDVFKVNDQLSSLALDISSLVFYTIDATENLSKFNFPKYNEFFKLVCSGKGGYQRLKSLTLFNFDLFHTMSHDHKKASTNMDHPESEDTTEDWEPLNTNTFEYFMKFISNIPFLTLIVKEAPQVVRTCKNCGLTTKDQTKAVSSLRESEWNVILEPILSNKECSVFIYDHKSEPLFWRRANTIAKMDC